MNSGVLTLAIKFWGKKHWKWSRKQVSESSIKSKKQWCIPFLHISLNETDIPKFLVQGNEYRDGIKVISTNLRQILLRSLQWLNKYLSASLEVYTHVNDQVFKPYKLFQLKLVSEYSLTAHSMISYYIQR